MSKQAVELSPEVISKAVREADEQVIIELINADGDFNANDEKSGKSLLACCILRGFPDAAYLMAFFGSDIGKAVEESGGENEDLMLEVLDALLSRAAFFGEKDLVDKLLALGTDVFAKDRDGKTPLFYAVNEGKNDNVTAILVENMYQESESDVAKFAKNLQGALSPDRFADLTDEDFLEDLADSHEEVAAILTSAKEYIEDQAQKAGGEVEPATSPGLEDGAQAASAAVDPESPSSGQILL